MSIRRALILATALLAVTNGAVFATHTATGLTSTPLGRGAWDRANLADLAHELGSMHAAGTSDVFVVKATLAPGGDTDWHGHTGPSVVVVTIGTIRVLEETPSGGCAVTDYGAGEAFFHTAGAHNFVNPSTTGSAEFLVTYFVPPGSPVTHDPDPGTC